MTGYVKAGKLTAIMGSTGAGKSTFIDILAGRSKSGKIGGTVLVNGERPRSVFNKIGAYVLQQDLLIASLTVQETFMFYANLHLDMSQEEKRERVDKLITTLALTPCRDGMIGNERQRGISGGEMKRVAIGVSMITDPSVLILDEPTSGLDSYNALSVLKALKTLASTGMTILCTIHQPSSTIYDLLDDLILLHRGRVAYIGLAKNCVPFMTTAGFKCPKYHNPADFFMEVLIKEADKEDTKPLTTLWLEDAKGIEVAKKVDEHLANHSTHDEGDDVVTEKFCVNRLWQFLYLLRRSTQGILRDPRTTFAALGQTLFLALLIGTLYLRMDFVYSTVRDRFGVMYFVAINQAFSGFPYLSKFLEERDIFQRERAAGNYKVLPYFLAKTLTEIPGFIIFPFILATIVYWMTNLNNGASNYFIFIACIITHTFTSLSLFVTVGSIAPNPVLALILAPIMLVLFFLFGGFFISMDNIPVYYQWFGYLSFFRYTTRILVENEFAGQIYTCDTNSTLCGGENGTYSGDVELIQLGVTGEPDMWGSFLILVGMIIAYRTIAFTCVYFLHVEKR
eukprot:TRINITY_DN8860_c0_g1_i1.p1 TRINITY_DN8860_c0_g1~~TRINITY_DN8860_c0_g1_i1.p1  ORF type:complete len:616 (-),score=102.66 TRINITY_DN8860_c0_g1_i1:82-1779(-)